MKFLLLSLFIFSCSEQKITDLDVSQISIEIRKGNKTQIKYFSPTSRFEEIPTVGKVDSVSL